MKISSHKMINDFKIIMRKEFQPNYFMLIKKIAQITTLSQISKTKSFSNRKVKVNKLQKIFQMEVA